MWAGLPTLRRLRGKPRESAGYGDVGLRRVRRGELGQDCSRCAGCGESLGKMWGLELWGAGNVGRIAHAAQVAGKASGKCEAWSCGARGCGAKETSADCLSGGGIHKPSDPG